MLAVDNASVRLARSHVHTGFTERLPVDRRLQNPDVFANPRQRFRGGLPSGLRTHARSVDGARNDPG